jgi:hypothetical protein
MRDTVRLFNESVLDSFLKPTSWQDVESQLKIESNRLKSAFDKLDKHRAIRTIISTLWHSKLPCTDVKGELFIQIIHI